MATLWITALIQKVKPLTDKNWHKWKSQVIMVFCRDGNVKLVQGTEKCPPPEKMTNDLAWDEHDDTALTII